MPALLDLVSASVKLTRRGNRYVGLCPFHNEKSPSFHVYEAKRGQRFHCFGCGADGEAIEWVMRTRRATDEEAREILRLTPPRGHKRAKPVPRLTILEMPPDEQDAALKRLHQTLWSQTAQHIIAADPDAIDWLRHYNCARPE